MVDSKILSPGSTIGIIGGGQLGRMTAIAAAELGYRCHVFTPDIDSPATQVVARKTIASYEDQKALTSFAKAIDVVTFEFENIPAESVRVLENFVPVRPSWRILEISQNRILEKSFLNNIDVPTTAWKEVRSLAELEEATEFLGFPSVLKTARFGYDGKGQIKIANRLDLTEIWRKIDTDVAILEKWVSFTCEVSCIVARDIDGNSICYDVAENEHRDHILYRTLVPARTFPDITAKIRGIAIKIAEALDLVGLLSIEFFITHEGKVLANEFAPRPHNSGHWTLDACVVSQFEQVVRSICGLPLGKTQRHSDAEMVNLIGDDVENWANFLREASCKLHLYGKAEARSGRKMGHITRLKPLSSSKS